MHVKISIFICLFISLFYHVKTENTLDKFLKVHVRKVENIHYATKSSGTNCSVYQTEDHKFVFVKENPDYEYEGIFKGEFEGLKAIRSTNTISVPKPIATGLLNNDNHFIAMEYLDMSLLSFNRSYEFGKLVADMHLTNLRDQNKTKFGFHVETYCGIIPQNNTWTSEWVEFFIENRIENQMRRLRSSGRPSDEDKKILADYWYELRPLIKRFFKNVTVRPSLLHGNLWNREVEQANKKPVIFNPAAFYGHYEYDIASSTFLGRYPREFYKGYFEKIPKTRGYDKREKLYHLFHHLNNYWNSRGEVSLIPAKESFRKLIDSLV